jgi:hypothetical protein
LMNQFPQHAFVKAVAIGRIKTTKAAAADRAAALGIQRETILKWCPATRAEELCAQWLRLFKTSRTHRDARRPMQGIAADPAIVGEEQGKKGVKSCSDC